MDFLLTMMSDNFCMALIASTQRAHFLLAWNCFSFTFNEKLKTLLSLLQHQLPNLRQDSPADVLLHEEGMLQALGGRHPAPAVPHQEVRYEVLDRRLD